MRQELQPFLHTVKPGPETYRESAETGSLAPPDQSLTTDTASALSYSSSQNAGKNGSMTQGNVSSSTTAVSCSDSRSKAGNGPDSFEVQKKPPSSGAICSEKGGQLQHRMPTQQELIAAGRMDLLNAMRVWGGFTAVADLMGVHPNTRYTLTPFPPLPPPTYPTTSVSAYL